MKCDHCENPATVHVTHVANGKVMKAHLCESCSKKLGVSAPGVLTVSQTLLGLDPDTPPLAPRACSACGMTLRRFQKEGRLGCPACYQTFAREVEGLLYSLHHAVEHCGRVPGVPHAAAHRADFPNLNELQDRLTRAIRDEDYEDAARLRDEIRQIQEGGGTGEMAVAP